MEEIKRGRGAFDGWSKSSLKQLLEGCSWQWALQKIGGLHGPATPHSAAGTGLHAAIEEHERARIEDYHVDHSTLYEIAAREAWADAQSTPDDWRGYHGGPEVAAQWAVDLLDTWLDSGIRARLLSYQPIAVEPHYETVNIPVASTLRGYIDWVGRDAEGHLTVVDYKTAGRMDKWRDPNNHLIESAVYLYLLASSDLPIEDEPIRMEWHVVSRKGDSQILRGPTFTSDSVEFLFARLVEAQAIVDAAAWKPNPSWGLCSDRWCPFYHGCQVAGTLSPESVDFKPPALLAPSPPE